MVIFPLAPDQTMAQMWSNGARGGGELYRMQILGGERSAPVFCLTLTKLIYVYAYHRSLAL